MNKYKRNDCLRWKLLNPAKEEHKEKLKIVHGRFTGDPSHVFECKRYKVVGQGDDERIEEDIVLLVYVLFFITEKKLNIFYLRKSNLKEEDRLTAVISQIEEDTLIIPRAAFIQQPTGEIVKNRLFEGNFQILITN